jgi:ATP-dependent helicase/nuclease subunit B
MGFSLYLGPFQPFLENQLEEAYRRFRAQDSFSPLTVLVPNFLLAGHLQKVLAEKTGGLFNLQIHTLRHYLEQVTEDLVAEQGMKVLPDVLIPWVLKEVARPLTGKGSFFAPVSETPGFPQALRATLLELQEGLFSPDDLKKTGEDFHKGSTDQKLGHKLETFAAIQKAYKDWKKKGSWMDRMDSYEKVLEMKPPPETVWVYGFYDAPALQRKVLIQLTQTGPSRWFIPFDSHPAFEYARPFVQWAKGLGTVAAEENWKAESFSSLGSLQSSVFLDPGGSPRPAEVPFEESDLKILLCPGEPREAKEIARILLSESERRDSAFSDCAVVLREPDVYRGLLTTVFQSQELPLSRALPKSLLETLEAKTLLILLECLNRDFPRDAVMNLLSGTVLNPAGFGLEEGDWNPSVWDVLSREAKIVEGKNEWLRRLLAWSAMKARKNAEQEDRETSLQAKLSARCLEQVLKKLFEAKARFDAKKTWTDKAIELAETFRALCRPGLLVEKTAAVLENFGMLGVSLPLLLTNGDFYSIVAAMLEEGVAQAQELKEGGAQIVDLMQARGVSFEVAVLPGLVERSVPRLVRQDPLLLDQERIKINENQSGKKKEPFISLKQAGAEEERLLFLLAVRSAKKALVLTAPHLDSANGSPRTPSIYLFSSVEAALGKRLPWLGDAPGLVQILATNTWVKPDISHCADSLERLLTAMHLARKGDSAPAFAAVQDIPFYFEGCDLLKNRQLYRIFSAHDGILAGKEAKKRLSSQYSPKHTPLSASRTETFAACPLRYFFRYVLGLSILEEPEQVLQIEPLDKGNLLHGILEETFNRGKKEGWLRQRDLSAGKRTLKQVAQKTFETFEKEGVTGAPGLWLFDKQKMQEELEGVLQRVIQDEDWLPMDFEVAFGAGANERPVHLGFEDGSFLSLQGRMDRVDVSSDGKALRVVDYKTGSSSGYTNNQIKAGTKLQLPFYLYALSRIYPEKEATTALYDFITQKGGYLQKQFDSPGAGALEKTLVQVLSGVLQCAEGGLFPAAGKDCEGCDYRRFCGTGMEERGRRKQGDPQVAAYYSLEGLE